MKSFKEYVLEEDINNWIASQLSSKYKNGKLHMNLSDTQIKAAIELYKQEHPNESDEVIKNLNKEKIREIFKKINNRKSAKIAFGSKDKLVPVVDSGDTEQMRKTANNIKNKYKNNEELTKATNNFLKKLDEYEKVASIQTEAEDKTEADLMQGLRSAAEKVDAIVKSLGDKYEEGTPGEKSAIESELAQYISKLASDTRNISNENGGEILKTLINVADKNKDKKLTSLEVRDYVSTNNNIKDGTNLKFILALLWFKTQNAEMYKKALLTDSGSAKANGISEAVLKQYNKLVAGVVNLSLGEDIMKLIGGNISGFSNIEEFSKKLDKAAKELSRTLADDERNKLRATSNNEIPSTSSNSEKAEDKDSDVSSENPDSSSGDSSSGDLSNVSKEEKKSINSLNVKSTNNEITQAINDAFGEADATDPSKMGTIYNSIVKQANETKDALQKLDKDSRDTAEQAKKDLDNIRDIKSNYGTANKIKSAARRAIIDDRDTVAENVVLDTLNNNKLLKEVALVRKMKNKLPTFGKSNLSKGNWEHFFDELKETRNDYSDKAHKLANTITLETVATTKRAETIVKLKNLYNDYFHTMMGIYYKAKKANNYNSFGLNAYNKRGAEAQKAQKEKEKFENSKFGKSYNLTKENIEERVKSLTVKDLDNIYEDLRPVFAYAIINYHKNKAILDGIDVSYHDSSKKKKVIDSFLDAVVKHHDKFGVGTPNEARLFIDTFIEQKVKEPEINEWLIKYDGEYKSKQQQQPIIDAILALNKAPNILKKLQAFDSISNVYKLLQSMFADFLNTERTRQELIDAENPSDSGTENKNTASVRTESLTFKEYYMLNEGLFNKNRNNNNNQQQVINFSDNEKKAIAALCVFSKNEFSNAAAAYLSKVSGRSQQLTPDEIKKAAEVYKNKNPKVEDYSNSFESIVNTSKKTTTTSGATEQQTAPNNGATGQQEQTPQTDQQNQQQQTPQTGGSSFDPDAYEQGMAWYNDQNKIHTLNSVVTSGAVGGHTIPDRLYKQLIRRRIK